MVWKLTDGADFYRILEQREFIAFLLARAQRWEEGGGLTWAAVSRHPTHPSRETHAVVKTTPTIPR